MDGGWGRGWEKMVHIKTWGDVQVITQYARAENARCEEVTTQISIATTNASDCLVAVFFCVTSYVDGQRVGSVMDAKAKTGGRWPTISCDDVPCCRIERYRCQRKEEGRFGHVDESTERHDCYVVVEVNSHHTNAWPKILRTLSPSCTTRRPDIY
jgi:hypothetical protein